MSEALLYLGELPFQVIRCPNLKIKLPRFSQPSPMTVFVILLASMYFVLSGIIYDLIIEPPSYGSQNVGGAVKPIIFMEHRVNGQYIIEGLSGGFMYLLGGLGIILLDRSQEKGQTATNRTLFVIAGFLCTVVAYNCTVLFLKMKMPGYLIPTQM